ncbi:hypothetical protein [Lentzea sp. NPDC003310]
MTTTHPLVTGPAAADVVMSALGPEARTVVNAHRKNAGALAIR